MHTHTNTKSLFMSHFPTILDVQDAFSTNPCDAIHINNFLFLEQKALEQCSSHNKQGKSHQCLQRTKTIFAVCMKVTKCELPKLLIQLFWLRLV